MRMLRLARYTLVLIVIGAAAWMLTGGLFAQGRGQRGAGHDKVNGRDAAAGEVLVKFRNPKSAAERAQVNAIVDAEQDDDVDAGSNGRLRRIKSRRFDAATLLAYFNGAPDVEYAEPNYILYAVATPTDPSFGQLYGLLNTGQSGGTVGADIDATLAWDITTGTQNVVVGVVDTGVAYGHEDLAGNIWSAPSGFTVVAGGVSVTCPAGSHGYNAVANNCDPNDDNNHGSHVSGTIGARANNGKGVAGINWTTSIMGLKFLSAGGSGSTTDAIEAIDFAIKVKQLFPASANVRVLSNSWGGGGFSQSLLNKINEANAADMLFVAAAGNNGTDNDAGAFYPSNYTAPNVVAVAATDRNDLKASFSNYGATTVDLGAPGVSILSTTMNDTYSYFSGTSMATPHVSGAAALVLSKCSLNTAALKSNILGNVDAIASMSGITVSGGRLNVNKALTACNGAQPPPQPQVPAAPTGLTASGGNARVTLNWNAPAGAVSYNIYRATSPNGQGGTPIGSSNSPGYVDLTATNNTTFYYKVAAVNAAGEGQRSNEASATPNAGPAAPTGLTASQGPGKGKISLNWNDTALATSYTVKRATVSGGPYTAIATTSTSNYTNSGVQKGVTFYYVVSASNANGTSGNSNQASASAR